MKFKTNTPLFRDPVTLLGNPQMFDFYESSYSQPVRYNNVFNVSHGYCRSTKSINPTVKQKYRITIIFCRVIRVI